jgi:hypothetical protein
MALLGFAGGVAARDGTEPRHTLNRAQGQWADPSPDDDTRLFMEQYHQGTLAILAAQRGELDQIGELSSRAARVVRDGGTVWTWMTLGHLPRYEQQATRRGSPAIMQDARDFDSLKGGDMIFTDRCNRDVLSARERGVYVVCVTSSYQDNEFRPAGFTDVSHSNPDGLMLKDVSNQILHSHTPYTQGLVHAPQIPALAICPSSATGSGSIHWMLNAELANKLATPDAPAVSKSREYLETLTERVERLAAHLHRIRATAVTLAGRIRAGGRWFARSLEHPGLEAEYHVASGPRVVNWGDWSSAPAQNVFSVTGISPAHEAEVELAAAKRAEGAFVVGIAPSTLDGVAPKRRLIDVADAGFDSFSPESGGVIRIAGRDDTICPTSGLVANIIQQMIVAQWADEMLRRGAVPHFLMGSYQRGGDAYNEATRSAFERQGF